MTPDPAAGTPGRRAADPGGRHASGGTTATTDPGAASTRSPWRGLLVVGDVVTDVVARHTAPLAPHTDTAAHIALLPGGAGANVACWAARCGARTRLLARVGEDSERWHRDALDTAGVEAVLRLDPDVPTTVVIALVDAAAERTLVTDSGASVRLGPADWDDALLDGGIGHVHLSGYLSFSDPGRRIVAVIGAAARARGIPVSVDPASEGFLRDLGPDRFLAAVADADLLLPNAAEAALLSGRAEPAAAAEELSARTGAAVVVTLGARGALAAVSGRIAGRVPAPAARAVDTTGAGDAFTGGFLAARLTGAGLADQLASGCAAAALAVTVPGGRPPD